MPQYCANRAAWLAAWLLAGVVSAAYPAAPEPEQPLTARLPFVPDVPGAEEARAWLAAHQEERQQRAQAPPAWPASLSLPSCLELSHQLLAGQPRQLAQGRHGQGQEGQQAPTRHLILATVSDAWGADASKNRCFLPGSRARSATLLPPGPCRASVSPDLSAPPIS